MIGKASLLSGPICVLLSCGVSHGGVGETRLPEGSTPAPVVSRDYQSQGFSLNIEGEVHTATSDPKELVEEIKELYDLAEEALDQQIERAQSASANRARRMILWKWVRRFVSAPR
jgi:hypothetical protein